MNGWRVIHNVSMGALTGMSIAHVIRLLDDGAPGSEPAFTISVLGLSMIVLVSWFGHLYARTE